MLFSRNVVNLLLLMTKSVDGKPTGEVVPDFSDEIIDAATVTTAGARRTPEAAKKEGVKK